MVQESRDRKRIDILGDRLRATREAYGISLRELARRVGVSASLISQIETGKVHPSVSTLYSLASELDASVDELLFEDAPLASRADGSLWDALTDHPHIEPVQRSSDRTVIELGSGVRWERLTTRSVPGFDFLNVVYQPGATSGLDTMQRHPGYEWGYVVEGKFNVTLGHEEHILEPGDSIAFDSMVPHRLHNDGDIEVRAIWFVLGWQSERPVPPGSDQ